MGHTHPNTLAETLAEALSDGLPVCAALSDELYVTVCLEFRKIKFFSVFSWLDLEAADKMQLSFAFG